MKKIVIGQIGIGHNHGAAKMAAIRKFPELFEVAGICETDRNWIEKRGAMPEYAGLPLLTEEELLDRCDAVLVETDVWNLTKTARRCIDAGKHIHMDKPACGTDEDFASLLAEAKRRDLTVQMGYMYRYNPAILSMLDHIKNGDIGEIYSINAEMSTFHAVEYKQWLTNFNGGIMYILGSHLVDLAVYLLGAPKEVHTFMKHSGLDGVDFADNDLAVLEYDKALVRIFVSSVEVNGWGRRQFMVSGSKGTIDIKPMENPIHMTYSDLNIAHRCYEDEKTEPEIADVPKDCRYDSMVQDLYSYIVGEKQNPFSYDHDLTVHKVINRICGIN